MDLNKIIKLRIESRTLKIFRSLSDFLMHLYSNFQIQPVKKRIAITPLRFLFYGFLVSLSLQLLSCTEDDTMSLDVINTSLLPDSSDYLSQNYGTQDLAVEMKGVYYGEIGLVIYDAETRTQPVLYLTRGDVEITIDTLSSGAVTISYYDFQTLFMPLKMDVTIKGLLEKDQDIIRINGSDGIVRTNLGEDMPIGTPLPESDDAEMTGTYYPETQTLGLLIDLMLPVPIKALVRAEKKEE